MEPPSLFPGSVGATASDTAVERDGGKEWTKGGMGEGKVMKEGGMVEERKEAIHRLNRKKL